MIQRLYIVYINFFTKDNIFFEFLKSWFARKGEKPVALISERTFATYNPDPENPDPDLFFLASPKVQH